MQSVTFSTIGTAIGIAEDLKTGIIDRFRSLPMAHASVLAGRVISATFVSVLSLLVMLAVGYLVGSGSPRTWRRPWPHSWSSSPSASRSPGSPRGSG